MIKQWQSLTGKIILLLTLCGFMSACGFQLRGAQEVSADKQQVTIISGNANSELLKSLRQNMKFNGVREIAGAPYQIQLRQFRYKRRAATISSSADVDEYELSVEVVMLVADQQGNPVTSDIKLQRDRTYTYNKNAAAASSEQEELLRRELYNSVAQSILRRYLSSNSAQ
ncbi:LPS assembly lipoprotein LptE [Neptuniibacter sp. QD37_6]|uniref:LPS-assembly lipoprotein LptE n=1 Tax=Neptuniibacter sp. QD37_6 TaxID=3398210 RepID=UPI0039F54947